MDLFIVEVFMFILGLRQQTDLRYYVILSFVSDKVENNSNINFTVIIYETEKEINLGRISVAF